MIKDLPDELIGEWVNMGALTDPLNGRVNPQGVRNYAKIMAGGRIYLKRVIEAQKNVIYPIEGVKRLVDADLDWRLGEIGIAGDEVFVIRVRKGANVFGKWVDAHEGYPASEEWGEFGWTYTTNSHRDPLAAKIARTIVVAKRRMWMRVRRGTI